MLSERDKMFRDEERVEKKSDQLEVAEFYIDELLSAICAGKVKNLKYKEDAITSENQQLISDVVVGYKHKIEWETYD
jgi:hypothetical protein